MRASAVASRACISSTASPSSVSLQPGRSPSGASRGTAGGSRKPHSPDHRWFALPIARARRHCGAAPRRTTRALPVFTAYTSWHPGTSCDGRMRKSIPPRSHSNTYVLPSQSRSRKASGTSPSRASCTALIPLSRKRRTGTPRMIRATSRGFNASGLDAVVRSFLRHLHVVHVALAQTGCGDPHELRLRAQLVDAAAAGVAHPAAQAAHQLEDVHRQGTLVGNAPFDPLRDQLHLFRVVLEVAVARALLHRAHGTHPAIRLVGPPLEEDHVSRRLFRSGEG